MPSGGPSFVFGSSSTALDEVASHRVPTKRTFNSISFLQLVVFELVSKLLSLLKPPLSSVLSLSWVILPAASGTMMAARASQHHFMRMHPSGFVGDHSLQMPGHSAMLPQGRYPARRLCTISTSVQLISRSLFCVQTK